MQQAVTFTSHWMSCVHALHHAVTDIMKQCVHIISQIAEIRISFDGGATSLNFAEAAQGSTAGRYIYCDLRGRIKGTVHTLNRLM